MTTEMTPEEVKSKAEKRGVNHLSKDEVRFGLEYDLFTESQIVDDLGLDTPAKVQAVLAGDDPFDPAMVQASGNHLTLTEEEVKLIERRRKRAENEDPPTIKVGTAVDEEGGSYEDMTNDELRTEIASRNESRDEANKLSIDGRKADLVDTLEADDSAAAAVE